MIPRTMSVCYTARRLQTACVALCRPFATRYVERNPVEAGIVARAQDYPWSSAAAHCEKRSDPLLEPTSKSSLLRGIGDWSSWLAAGVPDECGKLLRRNARLGLPCGSASFVEQLGRMAGRDLRFHPQGGRRKKKVEGA